MKYQRIIKKLNDAIKPDDELLDDWFKTYFNAHKNRFIEEVKICESYLKEKDKILEFGSIPLYITGLFKELEYDITGLDICPERFSKSIKKLKLDVVKCDFEKERLPFGDNYFNIILFNEIFEHLRIDLISTFIEIKRIMIPKAKIILSTPNLFYLRRIYGLLRRKQIIGGIIYNEYEKIHKLGHMGHVRIYTVKEVCDFLERMNFKIIDVIYRNLNPEKKLEKFIYKIFPSLKQFFTIIAQKKE